jgi:hypothetical protein
MPAATGGTDRSAHLAAPGNENEGTRELDRVCFDTNDIAGSGTYDLSLPQSRRDLAAIGDKLCDGLRVIIYMVDELEMEALLHFDTELNHWTAAPIEGTVKHYY